jgi:hypothetical protein
MNQKKLNLIEQKLSYPQKQIASDCACFKYDVLPPR